MHRRIAVLGVIAGSLVAASHAGAQPAAPPASPTSPAAPAAPKPTAPTSPAPAGAAAAPPPATNTPATAPTTPPATNTPATAPTTPPATNTPATAPTTPPATNTPATAPTTPPAGTPANAPPTTAADAPTAVAPPPTFVADVAPICAQAFLRCEEVDTNPAAPSDITSPTSLFVPAMRELRACLDRNGATQTIATARIRGGTSPSAEIKTPGLDATPCIMQAKASLEHVPTAPASALQCTYECITPAPAPVVVAPPPPLRSPMPIAPTEPAPTGDKWYGWQTIIADAASVAVLAGGLAAWKVEPTAIGYGGLLLGTPIVHAVHGNIGRMFGSFVMRLLIPTVAGGVGGLAGVLASKGDPNAKKIVTSAGIGAGIAMGAIILIDFGALAWEKRDTRSAHGNGNQGAF